MSQLELDLSIEKIEKFNMRVPRYTSYPTVPNWGSESFDHHDYLRSLEEISDKDEPISLYIHIPFCARRCLFCGCNTIITSREERSSRYLKYLKKEIKTVSNIIDNKREVIQLHLGGGTPTHFSPELLDELFTYLSEHFVFHKNAEKSIEVHPSVTSKDQVDVLIKHDFNRLSMGVQDFTPEVQEKLNRYQTYEETKELIDYARLKGITSVNVDLIYGLPYQTPEGLDNTVEKIFELKPERIALYSYAHFPTIFPHHKGIPLDVIPQGPSKLELFLKTRRDLLDFGYQQVGFDHFTLEKDELWTSYQDRTLRRNFMGYTTKAGTDLIAFGWSGISELSNAYAQHSKSIEEYEELVDEFGVAVVKGYQMTQEDKVRKRVIMDILCQNQVDLTGIQSEYPEYYQELKEIAEEKMPKLKEAGFVENQHNGWKLTTEGQIFARVVAASFDQFFSNDHLFSNSV